MPDMMPRESGRALFNMLQFHKQCINSTVSVSIPRMAYQFHESNRCGIDEVLTKIFIIKIAPKF